MSSSRFERRGNTNMPAPRVGPRPRARESNSMDWPTFRSWMSCEICKALKSWVITIPVQIGDAICPLAVSLTAWLSTAEML